MIAINARSDIMNGCYFEIVVFDFDESWREMERRESGKNKPTGDGK